MIETHQMRVKRLKANGCTPEEIERQCPPTWRKAFDSSKSKIEHGLNQMEAGMRFIAEGLREIRDRRDWEKAGMSLSAFCEKELKLSRRRYNQILAGDDVRLMLADALKNDPEAGTHVLKAVEELTEGQARVLQTAPAEARPQIFKAALQSAVKAGKTTPSGGHIKAAKARVVGTNGHPEPETQSCPCPHCRGTGKIPHVNIAKGSEIAPPAAS